MTPDQKIAKAAQAKIAAQPELEAPMRVAWAPVEELVEALSTLYTHKAYAFQQMHRRGRMVMLSRFVEGDTPAACADAATDEVASYHADRIALL